jgi:hypothetical protein
VDCSGGSRSLASWCGFRTAFRAWSATGVIFGDDGRWSEPLITLPRSARSRVSSGAALDVACDDTRHLSIEIHTARTTMPMSAPQKLPVQYRAPRRARGGAATPGYTGRDAHVSHDRRSSVRGHDAVPSQARAAPRLARITALLGRRAGVSPQATFSERPGDPRPSGARERS